MTIRSMKEADLDQVVLVHRASFKGFFLDRMGPAFIRSYYDSILNYSDSIALVSINEDQTIDGLAVGFCDPERFYSFYRSRRLQLLPLILGAVLRNPLLIGAVLRNVRRVEGNSAHPDGIAELSSIASTRRGVGTALLDRFCRDAFEADMSAVVLTTDAEGNDAVLAFYERNGFTPVETVQRGDRKLRVYRREAA